MANITVQRKPGGYTDRARKYKVLVDGQEVGKVGAGETVTAETTPGSHEVQLKLDWGLSPSLHVDAVEGGDVQLYCEPAANPLTGFYYATLGRKRYIKLRQV